MQDYRRDMAHGNWWSLQEMRDQNMFVEDPRLVRSFFTDTCRRGNDEEIELCLRRGADINSYEATTHQTGLHLAASNAHISTMKLLLKNGADLESRDNNQETPMLLAARAGHVEAVKFLLQEARASVKATDRMGRSTLIHAIKSVNLELVEFMLQYQPDMQVTDKEWGWTPLHYAAASGSVEMCAYILEKGGNVYSYSKKGKLTPLMVAIQNEHKLVIMFLKEYIFSQPAQNITPEAKCAVWLGKKDAAYPIFATDREFTGILSICDNGERAKKTLWLDEEEKVRRPCSSAHLARKIRAAPNLLSHLANFLLRRCGINASCFPRRPREIGRPRGEGAVTVVVSTGKLRTKAQGLTLHLKATTTVIS